MNSHQRVNQTTSSYQEFLSNKQKNHGYNGFEPSTPNSKLYPFQRDIVMWAIRKGACALFEDCGLGKTPQQLEWAQQVSKYTKTPTIIFAPLAVSQQTVEQGRKFGYKVKYCKSRDDVVDGINITNYERIDKFDVPVFGGVVLDESSILKNYAGAIRNKIIDSTKPIRYKLACTATPAPNDYMELGNTSEFLGVLSRTEMLCTYFVHDSGDTQKWRVKGHAKNDFWKWVASWAVIIRKPSDIGYSDDGYVLPKLNIHKHIVKCSQPLDGEMFVKPAQTLQERIQARRHTIADRVAVAAKIANESDCCLVWCNLNDESDGAAKAISGCKEIRGSQTIEQKEKTMLDFSHKSVSKIVTKPKIAGHGMNWQHCSDMIFLGLSDSWEAYYQAVRRCWRFGQEKEVNAHIVIADVETNTLANIMRKEDDATKMYDEMVGYVKDTLTKEIHDNNNSGDIEMVERREERRADAFTWVNNDCVRELSEMSDSSVGMSVFSPPFAELYTYSSHAEDMGNSSDYEDFFKHFSYLARELYRVVMPGRIVAIHCIDIPAMKERDGYIGLKDFPGDILRLFQSVGFIYHSKHVIWKDPLIEATRTKALGLMHKQIEKDSSRCRAGLPDYLIALRKPGENPIPISHENGFVDFVGENEPQEQGIKYSHHVWRKYASPVWMDIRQSNTLNRTDARSENDEKHICPLQLDVIERAIVLWSNEGDLVLSPFGGIASEGYVAIKTGRRFYGVELKEQYWNVGLKNLENAMQLRGVDLFESANVPILRR